MAHVHVAQIKALQLSYTLKQCAPWLALRWRLEFKHASNIQVQQTPLIRCAFQCGSVHLVCRTKRTCSATSTATRVFVLVWRVCVCGGYLHASLHIAYTYPSTWELPFFVLFLLLRFFMTKQHSEFAAIVNYFYVYASVCIFLLLATLHMYIQQFYALHFAATLFNLLSTVTTMAAVIHAYVTDSELISRTPLSCRTAVTGGPTIRPLRRLGM